MEDGAISDVVDLLEDRKWDATMIQEGPFVEKSVCRILDGGHALFGSSSPDCKRQCVFYCTGDGSTGRAALWEIAWLIQRLILRAGVYG